MAIVDDNDQAFAILAGRPLDEAYIAQCQDAAGAIEEASKEICPKGPTKADLDKRWGQFLSRTFGFSHGGGRKVGIQVFVLGL